MLYWILTGAGILLALAGFVLMIKTQREQQRAWSRLLEEDEDSARERYQSLQKAEFSKKTRLSLLLILGGMALGILCYVLQG